MHDINFGSLFFPGNTIFRCDPVTAEILYCLATVGGASIVADIEEGRLLSADWPGVTADPGPSPAPCGSPSLNLVHSICPDGPP
ncbi:hypothetical protein MRS44_014544 [Fusarium solani]|uniref:uncharacterized protein n=1 Tax=Fusarium solani TaxID=169388 RepID=UPI0032C47D4B|nr:hypothetical protein MRS44_014544 [Fusarium solani]